MGQDKWCQIIDPLLAGTQGRAPTTTPHMAVGGGKGAQGGAATWTRGTHHSYPWDLSPCRVPSFDRWMTKLTNLLFPGTALPGFLIIPSVVPTSPASRVPQELAQSPTHPNAPVPLERPVGAKQMPWTKVYGPMTFIKPTQDKTTASFPTATGNDDNFKWVCIRVRASEGGGCPRHLSKKVPLSPPQEEAMAAPEFPAGFIPLRSVKRKMEM